MNKSSALADWTSEQIALGKKWAETWTLAAADLERIRRKEIRELDVRRFLFFAGRLITRSLPTRRSLGQGLSNNNGGKKAAGRE